MSFISNNRRMSEIPTGPVEICSIVKQDEFEAKWLVIEEHLPAKANFCPVVVKDVIRNIKYVFEKLQDNATFKVSSLYK